MEMTGKAADNRHRAGPLIARRAVDVDCHLVARVVSARASVDVRTELAFDERNRHNRKKAQGLRAGGKGRWQGPVARAGGKGRWQGPVARAGGKGRW
jgi:hypothetical protein